LEPDGRPGEEAAMSKQQQDRVFGNDLPGTRGDLRDDNDVEGHRASVFSEPAVPRTEDSRGPRFPHAADDEQDVEGHLFRPGPSTQGEIAKRPPAGDNPHGER